MNVVILSGRLTSAPDLKATNSGHIARLRIAVDRRRSDKTDFFSVTTFNKLAEVCARHLVKGQHVEVTAHLVANEWDDNGSRRFGTDIVAEDVTFGAKPRGQTTH